MTGISRYSYLVVVLSLTLILTPTTSVADGSNRKLVREQIKRPDSTSLLNSEVATTGNGLLQGGGSGSSSASPDRSSASGSGGAIAIYPSPGYPGYASGNGVGSASSSNGPRGGSTSTYGSGSGSVMTGYPVYYGPYDGSGTAGVPPPPPYN